MIRTIKSFLLSCIILSLTSCAMPTTITGCSAFAPFYPSRNDTLETKKQALIHNEVYKKLCQEYLEDLEKRNFK